MFVLCIEHEYIRGTVISTGERIGRHAWNGVLIDNTWYYIDCSWDDREKFF